MQLRTAIASILVFAVVATGCGGSDDAACDDFLLLQDIAVQAERDGRASQEFLDERNRLNGLIMQAAATQDIEAVTAPTNEREALTKAQPWFDEICESLR